MADLKNDNGQIVAGLRADIMRCSMETKNLLTKAGSIYVGTGETDGDHGGAYKTKELQCGDAGSVLTSTGSDLEYKSLTTLLEGITSTINITVSKASQADSATTATTATTATNVGNLTNLDDDEDDAVEFSIGDKTYTKKVDNVEHADYATKAGSVDIAIAKKIQYSGNAFDASVWGLYKINVWCEDSSGSSIADITQVITYAGGNEYYYYIPAADDEGFIVTYNGSTWSASYTGSAEDVMISVHLIVAYEH